MLLSTWGSLPIIGLCQGALIGKFALLTVGTKERVIERQMLIEHNFGSRMRVVGYGVLVLLAALHWYIVIHSPEELRPVQLRTIVFLTILTAGYKFWNER